MTFYNPTCSNLKNHQCISISRKCNITLNFPTLLIFLIQNSEIWKFPDNFSCSNFRTSVGTNSKYSKLEHPNFDIFELRTWWTSVLNSKTNSNFQCWTSNSEKYKKTLIFCIKFFTLLFIEIFQKINKDSIINFHFFS